MSAEDRMSDFQPKVFLAEAKQRELLARYDSDPRRQSILRALLRSGSVASAMSYIEHWPPREDEAA